MSRSMNRSRSHNLEAERGRNHDPEAGEALRIRSSSCSAPTRIGQKQEQHQGTCQEKPRKVNRSLSQTPSLPVFRGRNSNGCTKSFSQGAGKGRGWKLQEQRKRKLLKTKTRTSHSYGRLSSHCYGPVDSAASSPCPWGCTPRPLWVLEPRLVPSPVQTMSYMQTFTMVQSMRPTKRLTIIKIQQL